WHGARPQDATMILSPTKYLNKVTEQVRARLPEEVLAVALFQPQSPLVPGQSKHQARTASKHSFAFAVTPTGVHAFGLKDRGYFDGSTPSWRKRSRTSGTSRLWAPDRIDRPITWSSSSAAARAISAGVSRMPW